MDSPPQEGQQWWHRPRRIAGAIGGLVLTLFPWVERAISFVSGAIFTDTEGAASNVSGLVSKLGYSSVQLVIAIIGVSVLALSVFPSASIQLGEWTNWAIRRAIGTPQTNARRYRYIALVGGIVAMAAAAQASKTELQLGALGWSALAGVAAFVVVFIVSQTNREPTSKESIAPNGLVVAKSKDQSSELARLEAENDGLKYDNQRLKIDVRKWQDRADSYQVLDRLPEINKQSDWHYEQTHKGVCDFPYETGECLGLHTVILVLESLARKPVTKSDFDEWSYRVDLEIDNIGNRLNEFSQGDLPAEFTEPASSPRTLEGAISVAHARQLGRLNICIDKLKIQLEEAKTKDAYYMMQIGEKK